MATIIQRGDKWRVQIRMRGVSRSATFERHSDAKAWAARVETEIRDGLQSNQNRNVFFGDILERYLATETVKKRGKRSETYRINGILKSSLANIRLENLRPQDFADWRDARLEQVSGDSVNRELSTLSAVCEHAMKEWGLLRENPVRKISKPQASKERTRRPSEQDIRQICEALHYTSVAPSPYSLPLNPPCGQAKFARSNGKTSTLTAVSPTSPKAKTGIRAMSP